MSQNTENPEAENKNEGKEIVVVNDDRPLRFRAVNTPRFSSPPEDPDKRR